MDKLKSLSTLTTKLLFMVIVLCAFACTKDLYVPPTGDGENGKIGEVTLDNYFNYETTKSVQLNIDYGKDCPKAYFEVYAENPFEVKENQVVQRKDLIAVASGFTDENGVYNAKASITSSVSKVFICSFDFGVPTLYTTEVTNDVITAKITFENVVDLTSMVNKTVTRASKATITDYIPNTLGNWNSKGMPNYLYKGSDRTIKVSDNLKKYITTYFEEGRDNNNSLVTDNADLIVKEKANVWINYFGGTTGAQSVFAYYCYDKSANAAQIAKASKNACVIFPSAHSLALGDYSGVAVQLKYIDYNGVVQSNEFPADTRVGFLIWNNGWINGNNGPFENNVFYSTKDLNPDGRSHTAVFGAEEDGKYYNVITMEDWTDTDYNDVAFVIQSDPIQAIVVPPISKPGDREGTDTYRGLLGFEDNWPNKGDYDMNDVVMKYVSNVDYNYSNKVIGITDKFTLSWTGANYRNGFAYVVPFDLSKATVTVSGDHSSIDYDNNVITLFSDAKAELGVSNIDAKDMPNYPVKEVTYTVSIQFKDPSIAKYEVVAPYNPFITKNKNGKKQIETHLTNYKPSPLAENIFNQSSADISDGKSTFFVCKDGLPFAVHLDARIDTSVLNINLKEGERIDKVYPSFAEWATTRNPSIKWWNR